MQKGEKTYEIRSLRKPKNRLLLVITNREKRRKFNIRRSNPTQSVERERVQNVYLYFGGRRFGKSYQRLTCAQQNSPCRVRGLTDNLIFF